MGTSARWIVPTVAALAGVVLLGFWVVRRERTHAEAAAAASARMDEMTERLAGVERKRERRQSVPVPLTLATGTTAAEEPSAEPPKAEPTDDQTVPANDEVSKARERERVNRRVAVLDERLAGEARDPAWSREIETRISELATSLDPKRFANTGLFRTDCRSTICKVEWESGSEDEASRSLMILTRVGRSFAKGDPGAKPGTTRLTMFVARTGHELEKAPEVE